MLVVLSLALVGCGNASHPVSLGGGAGGADGGRDAGGSLHDAGDATHPFDAQRTDDAALDAHDAAIEGDAGSDSGTRTDAAGDAAPADAGTHDAGRDASVVDAGRDANVGVDAGTPALRYVGRTLTDGTSPDGNGNCTAMTPCYEWSGTQVVARFTGATSFSLSMADYGSYFDVYVDNVLQGSPVIGSETQSEYVIASGLTASATHEVSLYKRTEASSNGRTQILGYSFPSGGTLLAPAAPFSHRIEVIGDSISCGYGVLGPNASCTETSAYEDHDDTYGAITARNLDADLYTIASSGRGMYRNVDNTTTGTLPDIYGLALPYGNGTGGLWPSAWSFTSFVPDVVVIDLGTNDFVGGDPGTAYESAYVTFLTRVLGNFPNAWIFCTNGPMLTGTSYASAQTYIEAAVATIANPRVTYLAFAMQSTNPADQGCDGHPDPATHQAMAAQLTTAIKTALGW